MRADLALLDALRPAITAALPSLDPAPWSSEIRERALDELDLEHEADQQRAAARALRGIAGVEVPAGYSELAAPGANVSAFLEGPTLADGGTRRSRRRGAATCWRRTWPRPVGPRPVRPAAQSRRAAPRRDGRAAGHRRRGARDRARLAELDRPGRHAGRSRPRVLRRRAGGARAGPAPGRRRGGARAVAREFRRPPCRAGAPGRARRSGGSASAALPRAGAALAVAARASLDAQDMWLARGGGQLLAVLARLDATEDWLALLE